MKNTPFLSYLLLLYILFSFSLLVVRFLYSSMFFFCLRSSSFLSSPLSLSFLCSLFLFSLFLSVSSLFISSVLSPFPPLSSFHPSPSPLLSVPLIFLPIISSPSLTPLISLAPPDFDVHTARGGPVFKPIKASHGTELTFRRC